MTQTVFIDEANRILYKEKLLNWLETDYLKQSEPENHFWHNQEEIAEAFDMCNALIVQNDSKDIISYMTWTIYGVRAQIDIVEVLPDYRRQNLLKKMLSDFVDEFKMIHVLTASVIPQSQKVFSALGWIRTDNRFFFKLVRPSLNPTNKLSTGCVIAVCPVIEDFYTVKKNPNQYPMLYYQLNMDKGRKLHLPIIVPFFNEGYIAAYFNKELIAEGKSKHLFKGLDSARGNNLLIIEKIEPVELDIFNEKQFFSLCQCEDSVQSAKSEQHVESQLESRSMFFKTSKSVDIHKTQEIEAPPAKKRKS